MEMGALRLLGTCGMAVALTLGCGKGVKDNSKVLANVGGEKITEKSFAESVRLMVGDEEKAKDLLTNPARRDERNSLLQEMADQKTLIKYAEKQGLDKDPKTRLLLEGARANALGQVLMERLVPKGEPTEAELRAFYDEYAAKAKAAGQAGSLPPFEAVKAQLPAVVKRRQVQTAGQTLMTQAKTQVVQTIDPEYKSAAPAIQ